MSGGLLAGLAGLMMLHCSPIESMHPAEWANDPASPTAPLDPDASDIASARFPVPMSLADAILVMTLTDTFAVNMGDAYFPPRHVYAFNVILDSPDTQARLESVLLVGSQAGRLYALAGLSLLDSGRYRQTAAILRQEIAEVRTIDGCMYETQPLSRLVRKIERERLGEEFRARRDAAYEHFERAG